MTAEAKIAELGIELPKPAAPKGLYRPIVVVGSLAHTAGHLPVTGDNLLVTGRLGMELDQAAGHAAARLTGLAILASLRQALGSLDRVRRVVKVVGLVNSMPEFTAHPAVIDGCSELFAEVFGADAGVGVRSALGVAALPLGAAVEIEAVFEIEPTP